MVGPFQRDFTVNLNSNFTSLDTNMGLTTNVVFTTYRFNGTLYFATNNGLAYLDEEENRIKAIPGLLVRSTSYMNFKIACMPLPMGWA